MQKGNSDIKTLEFALRAFLFTIQRPAKKRELESTIGKRLDKIDLVDIRNYLLNRQVNTSIKTDIIKAQIGPSITPAIFTDGEIAQLITTDDNGRLIEVDSSGRRLLDRNEQKGVLMYISESEINPRARLIDLLISRRKKLILKLYSLSVVIAGTNLLLPMTIRTYYLIIIPSKAIIGSIAILLLGIIATAVDYKIKQIRARMIIKSRAHIESVLTSMITKRFIMLDSNEISALGNTGLKTYYKKAEQVSDYIHGLFAKAALDAPFIILYLIVVYFLVGLLVMIPIIAMVMALGFVLLMSNVNYKVRTVELKSGLGLGGLEKEIVQKKEQIQLATMEWLWMQRLRGLSAESIINTNIIDSQNNILKTISETMTQITGITTLVIGSLAALKTNDYQVLGSLIATMFVLWRIFTPFQYLMQAALQWQFIRKQFLDLESFTKNMFVFTTAAKINKHRMISGNIELINCTNQNRLANENTFYNVSFIIKKGTINVITGDNDNVKSNIIETIAQLNSLNSGRMLFDGVDSRQYNRDEIQESIAFVGDKPALFTGTLFENLRLMNPYSSKNNVMSVLQRLKILEDPYLIDLNLDSILTSDYINSLPSGTKRMLSFAQGLIKNSSIILIQQLGRGLNPVQFQTLSDFLQEEKLKPYIERKTIIYSTTNKGLLDFADKIIAVKDRTVIFHGTPDDLSRKLALIKGVTK